MYLYRLRALGRPAPPAFASGVAPPSLIPSAHRNLLRLHPIRVNPRHAQPRRAALRTSAAPRAKYKVEIATLGRKSSKDAAFDAPIAEYVRRMRATLQLAERHVKRDAAARALAQWRDAGRAVVLLHDAGEMPAGSPAFAAWLFDALEAAHRAGGVVFCIGDADGFPEGVLELGEGTDVHVMSLSRLTMTHKMVGCAEYLLLASLRSSLDFFLSLSLPLYSLVAFRIQGC